jgi:tRNA (guanine-N7-)-methyltransferase
MNKTFRIRSYVPRGRRTEAQERAYAELWPQFGLEIENGLLDLANTFGREAPTYLEPGFGSGQSLLAIAKAKPECNFIGVETHQPGIGAILMGIQAEELANLRIYYGDVIDVLEKCIPVQSLSGVQIFFPDPWQKRRHHQRRLIQSQFLKLLIERLKTGGMLHLATDWEDYARDMRRVLSEEPALSQFSGERSPHRPILTKFETRAIREGRQIWDMQTVKM